MHLCNYTDVRIHMWTYCLTWQRSMTMDSCTFCHKWALNIWIREIFKVGILPCMKIPVKSSCTLTKKIVQKFTKMKVCTHTYMNNTQMNLTYTNKIAASCYRLLFKQTITTELLSTHSKLLYKRIIYESAQKMKSLWEFNIFYN